MKFLILAISLTFSAAAFSATTATKATKAEATAVAPTKNVYSANEIVGSANEDVHFMTNVMGLFDGKTNVQANFFGMPQVALSVSFAESSEKTETLKKNNQLIGNNKVGVSTTQYGVGAAYYVWPVSHRFNAVVNPYLLTERKQDPTDVDNSTGIGIKADGMMRFNNFTGNLGLQLTSAAGSSTTLLNAAVGYLF